MNDSSMPWRSVSELSDQIHAGALSPIDLMEHLLARVDSLNGKLNAFRPLDPDRSLAAARAAEIALQAGQDWGPLHGIPFAVKDIIDIKGLPTTAGARSLGNAIAESDATVVLKLRRAGMVILGKTQTVKFAMGAPGINRDHGTPHNPWAEDHHVPGGSSSGSAVAVAAGLVPAALGTDTGGSVRIPAALCGTVGLKTTVGQVSRAGVFPISSTLDSVGPLTRSVEDAALLYQAMNGPDVRDPSTRDADDHDVLFRLRNGVRGMRIAIAEGALWDDVDPQVASAVRAAGDVFAGLGAHVEFLELTEAKDVLAANPRLLISSVEGFLAHETLLGPEYDDYDDTLRFRLAEGANAPAAAYLRARSACESLSARALETLADVDAFLAPTTANPALPVAEVDASSESYQYWNGAYSRNTLVGNLLGLCAVTVPCGFNERGLPIGLMVHAKPHCEAVALRVAYAYEQATDWHQRAPGLDWAI